VPRPHPTSFLERRGTVLSATATTLEHVKPTGPRSPEKGRECGSVLRLVLALGAAALLLLGIWASSAHEGLEGTPAVPISATIAGSADMPAIDDEAIATLMPAEDELGTAGLCLLGALCGVLLAIFASRALAGRPVLSLLSVSSPSLSPVLPRVRLFRPSVTPTTLGISRT